MTDSTSVARAVVRALVEAGVVEVVLAPGSRSAPLALELYDADARGDLRLHVRIDERSAGFLALGLSKGSHRPAAVVTTSGSAVANLHPAVLEARHAGVPLVVLSADRPATMRGTGANQTTEQHGLFGPLVAAEDLAPGDVPAAVGAVERAVRRTGPTQVNIQLDEPLVPADPLPTAQPVTRGPDSDLGAPRPRADGPAGEVLPAGPRTVVVAGDDAGPPARLLAESANWPLLAEPTSGSRTGANALRTYRLLLQTGLAEQIERVVVTGHPTLSRPVTQLISRPDLEVVSVPGRSGVCTDPGSIARHLTAMPTADAADPPDWLQEWRSADAELARAVDDLVASHADALPLRVAAEVAAAVLPHGLLVVGSSQPIRDLDLMGRPYPVGQRRRILGNRGLSGIDGTVSTAVGAALARQSAQAHQSAARTPPTRDLAYLGDLTFLHDAGGLVLGPDEPRPDLTLVVANDDGGAIFSLLEQGDPAHQRSFERVFGTPHGVDLDAWCAATRTAYEQVDDAAALRDLLATDVSGLRVIEVPLSRRGRRALEGDLRALLTATT